MPDVISPNMSLIIPTVGQQPGPDYADNINASLSIIDSHNHSPGSGALITPQGIDINADLSVNTNNLISLLSARFTPQASPLAGAADLAAVYVSGADLYYNDTAGNQVRITQGGQVVGSSGSITGLLPPASAVFNAFTGTFTWQSDVNTAATMDSGPLVIRKTSASSAGITVSPSNSLASDYSIVLPAALPASQKFVTLDNSGNLLANWSPDNSTLEISSNLLQIKAGGVSTTQLADNSITAAKLQADSVTTVKILNANVTSAKIAGSINLTGTATVDSTNIITTKTALGASPSIAYASITGSSGAVAAGQGITCTRTGTGAYTIGFSPVFIGTPFVLTPITATNNRSIVCTAAPTASGVTLQSYITTTTVVTDVDFMILAIGPK